MNSDINLRILKRKIINFRNYFLLIFFIFFLTCINFKNFNHVFALDTYSSSTPLKDIINKSDPSTYKGIEFIKEEKKKTSDGRLGDHSNKYEATFYLFEAKYHHSDNIKIWVNSEFKTSKKIAEIALRYSIMLGQVPDYFKSELKWVVIHGPWVDKTKCTCMWYAFRNEGVYIHTEMIPDQHEEEILIHELTHVTIDSLYYNTENEFIWKEAQKKDANYISEYAEKKPLGEDIAESAVAWVAVRCKKDRISKSVYKKIIKTIPNRIKIFDDLIFGNSLSPLICKK